MTIGERIRVIRTELGFTQTEFGQRIGVSQNHLTGLETNKRNVTERMEKLICSEFNVSEKWLRTGEGEMFIKIPRDDEISAFVGRVLMAETDSFKKRFVSMLAQLSEGEWEHLEHYARRLVEPPEQAGEELTIDEEVEAYRQELEAERKGGILPPSDASGA